MIDFDHIPIMLIEPCATLSPHVTLRPIWSKLQKHRLQDWNSYMYNVEVKRGHIRATLFCFVYMLDPTPNKCWLSTNPNWSSFGVCQISDPDIKPTLQLLSAIMLETSKKSWPSHGVDTLNSHMGMHEAAVLRIKRPQLRNDSEQTQSEWDHNRGHFTHKAEGPSPWRCKSSHWSKRWRLSKFTSHQEVKA